MVRGFAGFGAAMMMTPVFSALDGPETGVSLCLLLEIAVAGLQPGQEYELFLVDSLTKPSASRIALAKFKTWPNGAAVAQAIGPLRAVVGASEGAAGQQPEQRYLVVTATGSDQPVLQQHTP